MPETSIPISPRRIGHTLAATGLIACLALSTGCGDPATGPSGGSGPLITVADVPLPGKAVRFDYQELDLAQGHLVIAHMNDAAVDIVSLADGQMVKRLTGIPRARGVAVGSEAGRIFVTSSPDQLVIIDNQSLEEIARVPTGSAPDGVGWDPVHRVVGVSDQGDGAVSLIAEAGSGTRTQVKLGQETGNVIFDPMRVIFWAAVVGGQSPNELVAIDPVAAAATRRIAIDGCDGAHGVRLHPDGQSAFVACEGNNQVARVALDQTSRVDLAACGDGPDVMSIDPGLGWLYVAAESGNLTIFDIAQPGLVTVAETDSPGPHSHSVAVDPSTHRVFFPLLAGPDGTPVLRIMRPAP